MHWALFKRITGAAAVLGLGSASGAPVVTSVVPNGLNTAATTSGTTINITGGTAMGGNLFHSFSTLNLGTGSIADFNVSSNVANIIARVTGGASTIDGTLTSTMGAYNPATAKANRSHANLYLLNSAGVMFTSNAQVFLNGSLIVSTANNIKFDNGAGGTGVFFAQLGGNDVLSSSPVSAFGFLGNSAPAPISFTGVQITNLVGLHLIGGDLTFAGVVGGTPDAPTLRLNNLFAPAGRISLLSAGPTAKGDVPFDINSPGAGFATAPIGSFGKITLTQARITNVPTNTTVITANRADEYIRGGDIVLDKSQIDSDVQFATPVAGGNLLITADNLTLQNTVSAEEPRPINDNNRAEISLITNQTVDSGDVTIDLTGALTLRQGADIRTLTNGAGDAGEIKVTAATVNLDGTYYGGTGGNVIRRSSLESFSTSNGATAHVFGEAGKVDVETTGDINLTNGAGILSSSNTTGQGDTVNVESTDGTINVTGVAHFDAGQPDDAILPSIIGSNVTGGGNAQSLTVRAPTINILDGGEINSGTGTNSLTGDTGNGAPLYVIADTLKIDGEESLPGTPMPSGIFASTSGPGHAGVANVAVTGTVSLTNGGVIQSSSNFTQDAGAVNVTAGAVNIDGKYQDPSTGLPSPSGIFSATSLGAGIPANTKADGGTVNVTATGNLSVTNGGTISASSVAGNAGNVNLWAGSFNLASGGSIDTSAAIGGGNILLDVSGMFYVFDGTITSDAHGGANTHGGDIMIDPFFVVVDGGTLQADDAGGTGGNISIIANHFLNSGMLITATGSTDGTINITAPDLDLSGSLASLPASLESNEKMLRESCARSINHEFSSFIVVGRGGTEGAPEELQTDFGFDE